MRSIEWVPFPTGQLVTTVGDHAIEIGTLSAAFNGVRSTGSFKLSPRFRVWSTALAGVTSVVSCGIAMAPNANRCEKMLAIGNTGSGQQFMIADLSYVESASGSRFTGLSTITTTLGWAYWQHLGEAYFAGGASNEVYSVSLICGTPSVEQVAKTAPWDSSQVVSTVEGSSSSDYDYLSVTGHGTENTGWRSGGNGNGVQWGDALTINTFTDTEDDLGISTTEHGFQISIDAEVGLLCTHDFTYTPSADIEWNSTSIYIEWEIIGTTAANFNTGSGVTDDKFVVYVTDDGSTWHEIALTVTRTSAQYVKAWGDLAQVPYAVRQAISKIRIKSACYKTGGAGLLGDMYVRIKNRGVNYHYSGPSTSFSDSPSTSNVNYYVRYANGSPGGTSKPVQATVSGLTLHGSRLDTDLPKMGAEVTLDVAVATSPWDSSSTVDVYREVEVTGTGVYRYYKVLEGASNASPVTFTDYYTDNDLLTSNVPYVTSMDPSGQSLLGNEYITGISCGISWKGSNVLFDTSGNAYFGAVGTKTDWFWPGSDYVYDETEIYRPRTLAVTKHSLPVIAAVANDALYMFTASTTYVMNGDYPSTATAPVALPDVQGALSWKAVASYSGGALAANHQGLYFIYAPASLSGTADTVKVEELTLWIRPSWEWLLGDAPEKCCVVTRRNTIWVFCDNRFLYRDEFGMWSTGQWGDSTQIAFAYSHYEYGVIGMTLSGKAIVIGDYPTDGGTNLGGTNGATPADWSFTARRSIQDARLIRAKVDITSPTSGTDVSVTATTPLGGTDTITFTGANPVYNKSWPTPGGPKGRYTKVTVSGGPTDEVNSVQIGVVPFDERRNY